MPFPDDLLNPIEGPNPSGFDLRYDPIYAEVKEARREEVQAPLGMTERDRKISDNALVIKLTATALANRTKDLQLAAWLTQALLKQRGFSGLKDGLYLCHGLMDRFWDTLYPQLEDDDSQARAAPLGFVGTALEIPLKLVPLVEGATYGFIDYTESREVGYEDVAKSDESKKRRAQLIKEGKLSPELFDKAFEETPKKFYVQADKDLDGCLQILAQLRQFCDLKFTDEGPSFGPLRSALESTRHIVHGLLQKKREKDPDPIDQIASQARAEADFVAARESADAAPMRVGVMLLLETSSEHPDRIEAVRKIAEAAAFLRRREPHSPAPYLMLRGLRWGELRAAVDLSDPTQFEAPPTELRKHLKRLAIDKNPAALLEAAENAMALPCSRAWMDLQRFVVEACEALGSDYDAIARAIRSEVRALIVDFPQLLDATLMDDTAAANSETRSWLKSLTQEVSPLDPVTAPSNGDACRNGFASRWPGRPADAYAMALRALRDGQHRRAFEILQQEIGRLRSGRERFLRKMQLVEMCESISKQNVAQPILDDLAAAIETHKLDDWEDPEMVASALATIMKLSQRVQADKVQQQKLFERICRLDPAEALGDGK